MTRVADLLARAAADGYTAARGYMLSIVADVLYVRTWQIHRHLRAGGRVVLVTTYS